MSKSILTAKILGISTSLLAAGGILSLSAFVIPPLTSPSSPSTPSATLQSLRLVFSRGSHVFPELASLASAAFAYVAYHAPSTASPPLASTGSLYSSSSPRASYVAASLLSISIAPFTVGVMVPAANGRLRELMGRDAQGRGVEGREVQQLARWFGALNYVRGALLAAGGVVGLAAALSGM